MLVWLMALASAQQCTTEQHTEKKFRPEASEEGWGDSGGWDKSRLRGMGKEEKKLFKKYKTAFSSYPSDAQDDILAGNLRSDLDEVALFLTWGSPAWVLPSSDSSCRSLLYTGHGRPDALATTCGGAVEALSTLQAPISCGRLDQVAPRMEKAHRVSGAWTPEQQVAVLLGVPQQWMNREALEMSFGKPEKKWNKGTKLRFSDDSGKHEGPTVVLADGLASSWSFPATDVLNKKGRKEARKVARDQQAYAREEKLSKARSGGVFKLLGAAVLIGATAAVEAEQSKQGGGGPRTVSSNKESYKNHQKITCNGNVLFEETFTSRDTCLQRKAKITLECSGIIMPIRC